MNLNKKRLQTLTDSSVVDCTASPHSKLFFSGEGGGVGGVCGEWEGLTISSLLFTG